MKAARFLVSPSLLADVLALPKGSTIVSAGRSLDGLIEVVVVDDDLDDSDVHHLPLIKPTFSKGQDGTVRLESWGKAGC